MDNKLYRNITVVLLSVYGIIMLYFCARIDALVPDEKWFFGIAQDLGHLSFVDMITTTQNNLGYGCIFWITLAVLRHILFMRIFSWLCLLLVPVCIVIIKKRDGDDWEQILFAMLLFLSCPFAWFTGKIIGPELFGNAWGALGVMLMFIHLHEKQIKLRWMLIGGILEGIASGIKLYNVVFVVFAITYVFCEVCRINLHTANRFRTVSKCMLPIVTLVGSGCVTGFVLANPILIFDKSLYFKNIVSTGNEIKMNRLWPLLTKKYIEWDLVESGGLAVCIISLLGLAGLMIIGMTREESRSYCIAACLALLAMIVLFLSQERILGWYFLPLILMLPLCVPNTKFILIVLIINFLCVKDDICYQLSAKCGQIYNITHEEETISFIEECTQLYPEYKRVNFVDVGMKTLSMDPEYEYTSDEDQLIAISRRAKNNEGIRNIYYMARVGRGGYHVVGERDRIVVVTYERNPK